MEFIEAKTRRLYEKTLRTEMEKKTLDNSFYSGQALLKYTSAKTTTYLTYKWLKLLNGSKPCHFWTKKYGKNIKTKKHIHNSIDKSNN